MTLLELFCGGKSVSKTLSQFTVVSLDILPCYNPTVVSDILTWNYKQYKVGFFEVIWASPPCTEYSKAKSRGIRNLELANEILLKTIEIIHYFQPKFWIIENPQTGLLKNKTFMNFPFIDADYCQYGYNYRKRTRFWLSHQLDQISFKLCDKKTCKSVINNKHIGSCGNGYCKYNQIPTTLLDKYSIPSQLIHDIFNFLHLLYNEQMGNIQIMPQQLLQQSVDKKFNYIRADYSRKFQTVDQKLDDLVKIPQRNMQPLNTKYVAFK